MSRPHYLIFGVLTVGRITRVRRGRREGTNDLSLRESSAAFEKRLFVTRVLSLLYIILMNFHYFLFLSEWS